MTIQRVISFFSILFISLPSFAQDFVFEGLINSELKVRVRYTLSEDNKVEGYCIFTETTEKHLLTGEKTASGDLILKQKNGEQFKGKVMASYMYKGSYLNNEGVEQGSFLLSKIDATRDDDEQLLTNKKEAANTEVNQLSETQKNEIFNAYLKEFKECNQKGIDPIKCRQYTAKAFSDIYGVDDFKDPYVGGQFLTMTEAYDKIAADNSWEMIGEGSATAFQEAQKLANAGDIVLLAYPFKGYIQIAMVRVGELKMSSKWGMKVPSVGLFFANTPEKSSASKSINYIWRGPDNIEIWVKK
ncbi:hypothetical protein [Flammeovirga pacifica]|uniref:Uncharacterized protein n=1 Tax=Flammeovirga pacifica TaxID=915059 RepID=A0A1S1YVN2_FLAPC|nr:hypothetical protein [Flammeovirga pacifica]OHX65086.1 hypothetical protein NH26_01330 [Flammeovirga pacifica]